MSLSFAGPRERAVSIDDKDEEQMDEELEARWLREGIGLNIRLGCKTLLLMDIVFLAYKARDNFKILLGLGLGLGGTRDHPPAAARLNALFFAVQIVLICFCLRRPRISLYLPLILSWLMWWTAQGLPPWGPSCEDLASICEMHCANKTHVRLSASNLDCSLQGPSIVHTIIGQLLITPRLVPNARMMYINWAYIFLVYVPVTFFYDWGQSEFAYHRTDVIITVVLLCGVSINADRRKFFIEKGQRTKFLSDMKREQATKKIFNVLELFLPTHVIVPMLKNPGHVIAEDRKLASVLFVLIEDFDRHARQLSPRDLMDFLNQQFKEMDEICNRYSVTKIETVAEEYVCAVGVIPSDVHEAKQHGPAHILTRLIKAALAILRLQNEGVEYRMGMQTGDVVAGVIGQKLPRFRLFGDTVNTAARMMQKGKSGCLQFGEETKQLLPKGILEKVISRGEIELKGKGCVPAYLLQPTERSRSVAFETGGSESLGSSTAPSLPAERQKPRPILRGSAGSRYKKVIIAKEGEQRDKQRRSTLRESIVTRFGSRGNGSRISGLDWFSSDQAEREDDREKFQQVLSELSAPQQFSGPGRTRSWWLGMGLVPADFTQEDEDQWQRWYHKNTICKKLEVRLDTQALVLALLTAVELWCSVFLISAHSDEKTGLERDDWHGKDNRGYARLPFFLACRGTAFAIISALQSLAKEGNWLLQNPQEAQLLLLVCFAVITVLVCIAYDGLSETSSFDFDDYTHELVQRHMKDYRRRSSIFTLCFIPAYVAAATQHQFRFGHTVVFPLLAGLVVLFWKQVCRESGEGVKLKHGPDMVCNLYLSHDVRWLLLFLSCVISMMAWTAEKNSRERFKDGQIVEKMGKRIDLIVDTLMPPLVVEEIRGLSLNSPPPTHKYRAATIAQSDLCGFTALSSLKKPQEVVQFIGELFGAFDDLTVKHQVYKVETVGDAYIAGQADIPLTPTNIPVSVVLFGLEMVRAVHDWAELRGWTISCRVGIAHGECIGGIVGTKMQRYHLFGELMGCLEVLESTAPEGMVQVSRACKEVVEEQMHKEGIPSSLVSFEPRKLPHLTTSKGDVIELEKAGGDTFIVRSDSTFRGWIGA
eukprot:TRINITY_DN30877_c0_g1_i1.p1 TRINITY_DN30877_c0_g1~~TRINITY_DN30877_c0_g1_i1.p1  ORF type:complete len:1103 (-),score=166.01 TRINITY_DN30877_c0_g1_i1:112-3420(-)